LPKAPLFARTDSSKNPARLKPVFRRFLGNLPCAKTVGGKLE
jgi:hypothetical protein